jgi:hypothetical protein
MRTEVSTSNYPTGNLKYDARHLHNTFKIALGCLYWFKIIMNFFVWVVVELCLELLPVFVVFLCGILMG